MVQQTEAAQVVNLVERILDIASKEKKINAIHINQSNTLASRKMFNVPAIHRNWAQLDEWTRNREPSIANQSKYIFKSIILHMH